MHRGSHDEGDAGIGAGSGGDVQPGDGDGIDTVVHFVEQRVLHEESGLQRCELGHSACRAVQRNLLVGVALPALLIPMGHTARLSTQRLPATRGRIGRRSLGSHGHQVLHVSNQLVRQIYVLKWRALCGVEKWSLTLPEPIR